MIINDQIEEVLVKNFGKKYGLTVIKLARNELVSLFEKNLLALTEFEQEQINNILNKVYENK